MMKRLVLTLCLVCAVVMGAMANDLATFEVSGKVQSITGWNPFVGYVGNFNFSATGKLIPKGGLKVKRNQQGKIVKVSKYDADYCIDLFTEIKYDAKGRVKECKVQGLEESWTGKYEYDAKGLVVKITKSGWCDGEEFEDVETFEYKKFDAKGNWTSRVLTSKSVTDPNSKPYVAEENRRIGYYK